MDKKELIKLSVHEIKTPISVIQGFADLINYGIISGDELNKTTDKIKQEAVRMSKLVDEIAFYMALEENVADIHYENADLNAVISEAVSSVKENICDEAEITVIGEGQAECDVSLMGVMMSHIIENAVIYNDKSVPELTCTIEEQSEKVILTIEDNGMGIREEEKDKIFECFYRVDKTLSRGKGGNGMGLAVCKKIAQAHNTDIIIDSEMGKGTRVTVELWKKCMI